MHVTILTVGTRGDVQPFVALGQGLEEAGHDVTVATGKNFASFVEQQGLHHHSLQADFQSLMESEEGREMLNGNPITAFRYFFSHVLPMMREMMEDAWEAAQNTDALLFHPKALIGTDLAEKCEVPCMVGHPLPVLSPTAAFPCPAVTATDLGAWLNRKTYSAVRFARVPIHRTINRWRRETLDLPKRTLFRDPFSMSGTPLPAIYGVSPHVVPPPEDWPENAHATGYWFLNDRSNWTPPSDLVDFLDASPPPVYVGFGSMVDQDPEETTRTVLEALDRANQRAVIATGWGGITGDTSPDHVYTTEFVPHEWLFPKVRTVIHHGGAGTTAEGLRAGTPTIVCPFFGDQPFWGKRVHELGAGPEPIPQSELTPESLVTALEQARRPEVVERAERIGEQIRRENGVERAVEVVHHYCEDRYART